MKIIPYDQTTADDDKGEENRANENEQSENQPDANHSSSNRKPWKLAGTLLLLSALLIGIILAITLPLVLDDDDDGSTGLVVGAPDVDDSNPPANSSHAAYDWNCAQAVNVTELCQASAAGLTELLRDHQQVPAHLSAESGIFDPDPERGDFNAATFFEVLEYLSLPEGTVLTYKYYFDFMGGYPSLYVHNQTASADGLFRSHDYTYWIQIDDSPQGFLQLVVLDILGEQFYRHWHSEDNTRIVSSSSEVEEIVEILLEYPPCADDQVAVGCFDLESAETARAMDVTPSVQCVDEVVQVRIVLFSEWGGFDLRVYKITRGGSEPRDKITDIEDAVLVPFHSGWVP